MNKVYYRQVRLLSPLIALFILMFFSFSGNIAVASPEISTDKGMLKAEKSKSKRKLAYLVSDLRIPFWAIMGRGVQHGANSLGYELEVYSAENNSKKELELLMRVINEKVSGIIVSPTTSSACVTILKLAKNAGIPVVISDIGTDSGEYVSYISSNNREGAYMIGKVLASKMRELSWNNGSVGIVAIPQKRLNGQARTAGFMQAMDEAGIKGANIKQQVTFSEEETYLLSKDIIKNNPNLRAIWLQGSNRYKGALRAIEDAGKKNEVLLITFDAEPEFMDLIPQGVLVGSAMQQPYLMGAEAVSALDDHLNGKTVIKNKQLPILAISTDNIAEKIPVINKNVLGLVAQ